MTIEDQIKGEKLQYDINREVAKISALLSGKIDKYKHLTGEEILPSAQQQIIDEAKFIYSPLGEAFEKQTKTNKDQGEKQIKSIQCEGPIKSIEKFNYDINDSPTVVKAKEIYNELTDENLDKKNKLDESVDTKKLTFEYKGNTADEDFSKFYNSFDLMDRIKNGAVTLNKSKEQQAEFKLKFGEIRNVGKDMYLKRVEKREQILKIFTRQKQKLLIFLMNILQVYQKLNIKQNKEKDSKY